MLLRWCEWLETTPIGVMVRESLYGFQIVVALHLFALVVSVGTILWFDLRLLGIGLQGKAVTRVYRQLMRIAAPGFILMFGTGIMLFIGYATTAIGNGFFLLKLTAMVLAGVNALVFHFVTERDIARWDLAARVPAPARIAGLVSIVLWAVVILSGRMMSYTMF